MMPGHKVAVMRRKMMKKERCVVEEGKEGLRLPTFFIRKMSGLVCVVGGIVMIIIQESFVTSARGWWKNAAEPCLV